MINLQAVKEAIDQLSPAELDELRRHLEKKAIEVTEPEISPEERIIRLDKAAYAIRNSFTDVQWDEIEQAMNEEYIEPWDSSEWNT